MRVTIRLKVSERIFSEDMAKTADKELYKKELFGKFLPKGNMTLELLLFQSVLGPIGLPAVEAVYPAVRHQRRQADECHEQLCDPHEEG